MEQSTVACDPLSDALAVMDGPVTSGVNGVRYPLTGRALDYTPRNATPGHLAGLLRDGHPAPVVVEPGDATMYRLVLTPLFGGSLNAWEMLQGCEGIGGMSGERWMLATLLNGSARGRSWILPVSDNPQHLYSAMLDRGLPSNVWTTLAAISVVALISNRLLIREDDRQQRRTWIIDDGRKDESFK